MFNAKNTISELTDSNQLRAHVRNANIIKAKSRAFRIRHNITVNRKELVIPEDDEEERRLNLLINPNNKKQKVSPDDYDYDDIIAEDDDGIITISHDRDDRIHNYKRKGDSSVLVDDYYDDVIEKENHTWRVDFAGGGGSKYKGNILDLHGQKSAEHQVFEYLFTGYNKNIRPTIHGGEPTYVFFEIALFNILEMVSKNYSSY